MIRFSLHVRCLFYNSVYRRCELRFYAMILFGIGWAAMMDIFYTIISKIVAQDPYEEYTGILNRMTVIPMGIETLTFGSIYKYV